MMLSTVDLVAQNTRLSRAKSVPGVIKQGGGRKQVVVGVSQKQADKKERRREEAELRRGGAAESEPLGAAAGSGGGECGEGGAEEGSPDGDGAGDSADGSQETEQATAVLARFNQGLEGIASKARKVKDDASVAARQMAGGSKPGVLPLPGSRDPRDRAPKRGRFNSFVGTVEYIAPEIISGVGHSYTVDFWIFGVMLYEMLFGVTPFRGADAQSTFANISSADVSFPEAKPKISPACKDLIRKLLVKNQKRRLGYVAGAGAIKAEPFFKDVKWGLLRNQRAPLTPPEEQYQFIATGGNAGEAVGKPLQGVLGTLVEAEDATLRREEAARATSEQQQPRPEQLGPGGAGVGMAWKPGGSTAGDEEGSDSQAWKDFHFRPNGRGGGDGGDGTSMRPGNLSSYGSDRTHSIDQLPVAAARPQVASAAVAPPAGAGAEDDDEDDDDDDDDDDGFVEMT